MLDLSEKLTAVVGSTNIFTGDAIDERYCIDRMRKYPRQPGYVLRPRTIEQIAEIDARSTHILNPNIIPPPA